MRRILALDPGPTVTGFALLDGLGVVDAGVLPNEDMLARMLEAARDTSTLLAIEMIASYGMAVGREVFETCVWVGRYAQAWPLGQAVLVYRQQAKLCLTASPKAKDANVRQAIIDLFPRTGGGKVPQVGSKKQPGPLFGVTSHAWPALAVAIAVSPEFAGAVPGPSLAVYLGDATTSTPLQRPAPRRVILDPVPVEPVPVARRATAPRKMQDPGRPGRRHRR